MPANIRHAFQIEANHAGFRQQEILDVIRIPEEVIYGVSTLKRSVKRNLERLFFEEAIVVVREIGRLKQSIPTYKNAQMLATLCRQARALVSAAELAIHADNEQRVDEGDPACPPIFDRYRQLHARDRYKPVRVYN